MAPYNTLMYLCSAVKAKPYAEVREFPELLAKNPSIDAAMFTPHRAENRTGASRVILFCDIERPLSNPVLRWINRTIGRAMIRAAATQNVDGEPVGVLNHIFSYVYRIRALGLRIKEWRRPVYYALKWLLIAAVAYAICVGF